jgi:Outer membrane protein beta-barrel domain
MKAIQINITSILLIISSLTGFSQIKYGARVGFNASNVSFKNVSERGEKYGFHAGGFAVIPISKNFMSVNPELSFSRKGSSFESLNLRRVIRLNYIDLLLPVSFKLDMVDIQVGPFVSILANKPTYKILKETPIPADGFKRFDAGLSAGLNYNFGNMFAGVRYNQGFMDITTATSRAALGSGKTATGQVSVGYTF